MNAKKTILLVDDEPNIRILLGAVLEREGFAVITAEDGFAALREIQRVMPDLVITDLRMPNMNGFELLAVLRSRFPNLPTIAISGEFLGSDVESDFADAFFTKGGYSTSDLFKTINELVEAPVTRAARKSNNVGKVWRPTGDAPVMLTCMNCLRTFPIDPCSGAAPSRQLDCIFCGAHLEVELVAIGVAKP